MKNNKLFNIFVLLFISFIDISVFSVSIFPNANPMKNTISSASIIPLSKA